MYLFYCSQQLCEKIIFFPKKMLAYSETYLEIQHLKLYKELTIINPLKLPAPLCFS